MDMAVETEQVAIEEMPVVYSDSFNQGLSEEADIGNFLTRSVQIATFSLIPGGPWRTSFDPWTLTLSNSFIKEKLARFKLMRCGLELEFVINGLLDHQGRFLVSYQFGPNSNEFASPLTDLPLFNHTCRPHIEMDAATSMGGRMSLPFFYPKNWIDCQGAADDIGRINIQSYGNIEQLDAGVNTVNITVFSRLTDVTLTAPTVESFTAAAGPSKVKTKKMRKNVKINKKAKDEYNSGGPVSSVSTAVAKAANYFVDIPIIGRFAKATEIGAGAISNIASLFGWSKPVNIDDICNYRPDAITKYAVTDGRDNVVKLTLTEKQELTVDPRTTGMPTSEDELSHKHLFAKRSYFHQFEWPISASANDWLFSVAVTPNLFTTSGDNFIPTLAHYMSLPYEYWCGTINFHFTVIVNQFTRGKLAVFYDPNDHLNHNGTDYNVNFVEIIDLAVTTEFSVSVPYMQDAPYLACRKDAFAGNNWDNGRAVGANANINGVLAIRVVNELNQRDNVTPVTVVCKVSLDEDFEFKNPEAEQLSNMSFRAASMENNVEGAPKGATPEEENIEFNMGTSIISSSKPLEFFGEQTDSVRNLIKRYCPWRMQKMSEENVGRNLFALQRFSMFPLYYGKMPGGIDIIGGENANNVATTYLHYAAQMFAGWRGGVRYKMLNAGIHTSKVVMVNRQDSRTGQSQAVPDIQLYTNTESFSDVLDSIDQYSKYNSGASQQTYVNDALAFELPYATEYRFSQTKVDIGSNPKSSYYPGCNLFQTVVSDSDINTIRTDHHVMMYSVAAAEDMNFFGFLGPPAYIVLDRTS